MEVKQARIKITGRVQGVFFRAFVRDTAVRLGLKGVVRNSDDGAVEVIVQGSEKAILSLQEACKKGPSAARVSDVDLIWEGLKGDFEGFKIDYGIF